MVQSLTFLFMLPAYALCVWGYGKLISYLDVLQPSWWCRFQMSNHEHLVKLFTCKWCLAFWSTTFAWLYPAHILGSITYLFMVAIIFYVTASQTL